MTKLISTIMELTKNDVARRLAVSVATVRNLIRRGEIPTPVKDLWRGELWEESTVDEWLKSTERLVSLAELVEMLGISQSTARRMIASGVIPKPIRIGRQLRWRAAELTGMDGGA